RSLQRDRPEACPALVVVGRLEVERERVDAVALAGRVRPVREDVAEMRVAGGAAHLDPAHAVAVVDLGLDRILLRRLEEAGPAGAGVELRVRAEELRPARAAAEHAVLLDEVEVARPGRLGGRAAKDRVAVRVELLPPLLVCLANFLHAYWSTEAWIRFFAVFSGPPSRCARTARISPRIESAVSSCVSAPMSRPHGPEIRSSASSGTPASSRRSRRRSW